MTSELLQTYQFLAAGLRLDPCLCLANAVAWLDPLWGEEVEYDEADALYFGLHVVRRAFPDIYADAVEAMRHGATAIQLDQIICGGISAYGIPLENVEWLGWGIPLPGYGARLEDPDFYEQHPDVVPVLALFGIHPETDERLVDVPAEAFAIAKVIADSLEAQADERWKQVGWLLRWLFSCSGNSSVDYDDEALSEFQPLAWDQEDIAFAIDIIEEADGIMQDVNAGLNGSKLIWPLIDVLLTG